MMDTTKAYIEAYKEDIEKGDFDSLYSHMKVKSLASALTEALLDADIDPLEYFQKKIPEEYGHALPQLKSILIPTGIESIEENAFSDCPNLTSVIIPETVVAIRNDAFYNCPKLKQINLPDSCLFLGSRALQYTAIETIKLPNITTIFQATFTGCKKLREVEFSDSITWIGNDAFMNCESLRVITLPRKLEQLGFGVFEGCTQLESVIIPDTLRDIDVQVFSSCPNLTSIVYNGTMQQWKDLRPSRMFDRDTNPVIGCKDGNLTWVHKNKVWAQI